MDEADFDSLPQEDPCATPNTRPRSRGHVVSSEYGSHVIQVPIEDGEEAGAGEAVAEGGEQQASDIGVTKREITLASGETIRRRSPRLNVALKQNGLEYKSLVPRSLDDFRPGCTLEEMVRERFEGFERRRRGYLVLVLEERDQVPVGLNASQSTSTLNDTSTMLARDQERKARLLRAEKMRAKKDAETMRMAEVLKAAQQQETQRVAEAAKKKRQDQADQRRKTKRAAERKQQMREMQQAEAAQFALRVKEEKMSELQARDAAIEEKRLWHEQQLRRRSDYFKEKTEAKMQKIAARQAAREQAQKEQAALTAQQHQRHEKERVEKLMTRRDRMARETAHRRRQIERRQLKNKESEEKRLLHERKAAETRLSEAEKRLETQAEAVERRKQENRHEQAFKERLRKKKIEEMRHALVMASGEAMGKAEAKELLLAEAAKRAQRVTILRKERSQLKYEAKMEHVHRMHRVQEFEEEQEKKKMEVKNLRLQMLADSKHQLRADRKVLAQQFQVSKQQLRASISRENASMRRATFEKSLRESRDKHNHSVELAPLNDWRGAPPSRSASAAR